MIANFSVSSTVVRKKKKNFDRHELFESKSDAIREVYNRVLSKDASSLTTIIGNDVASRFRVASARLNMTAEQRLAMNEIETVMRRVEALIDPERLYFTIRMSPDDEVVLNHRQKNGLCSLLIYDDGALAMARINAHTVASTDDELKFIDARDADYESLVLQFLSGQ